MKKLLSIFFFLLGSICVSAQKSYVHIYAEYISGGTSYQNLYLTGDIPEDVSDTYGYSSGMTIGKLLNILAEQGYVLEFMTAPALVTSAHTQDMCYVLSKAKEASSNSVELVKAYDDSDASDVHEVARYNLQGLPISEKEKGVQIVVYSNYTTKTIIRE